MLLAVVCGLAVANNYYAQPLLGLFSEQFHIGTARAALLVTVAQAGFMAGLVFVVPLGDRLERRRMLTVMLAITAVGSLGMAFAPGFHALLAWSALLGVASVAAQVVVPMVAHMSEPQRRGRTVATAMMGLLLGILLARTVSGVVADLAGWRAVYLLSAVVMAGLALACHRILPRVVPTASGSYGALLWSILHLFKEEPVLRRRALIGSLSFGVFGAFWTAMAFMLKAQHQLSESAIGLFALIGAAGVLCARFAGRIADKGWARPATGAFVLMILVSCVPLAMGTHSLLAFGIGVLVMDLGMQGAHICNQSEIYRLNPAARSRLTTGYMATYFLGGVFGSMGAGIAYAHAGWIGVCWLCAGFSGASLLVWAVTELRLPVARMRHGRGA